jgi:hypothetical protein
VTYAVDAAVLPRLPAPASFVRQVSNPWFPLRRGTTLVYAGTLDGRRARDVVQVLSRGRRIAGVPSTAVLDRVYEDGRLVERTVDWYAQDGRGRVWYLGERTAELDAHGRVTSTEGTWLTGVHGARAGLFMPARPRVGHAYQQELLRGHAEDRFSIASLAAHVATPYVTTRDALATREWTPLEPGVVGAKLYVYGVGEVAERSLAGPPERLDLVEVLAPR